MVLIEETSIYEMFLKLVFSPDNISSITSTLYYIIATNSNNNYISIQQGGEDLDPLADRRRPTIADREDEYRQKRRRLQISPERADPFADGRFHYEYFFQIDIFLEQHKLILN